MITKNFVNKVGDKLKDIKDIFGNIHHQATVVHIGENTVTINDDQTNERWIVSNLDIGKKVHRKPSAHGDEFDVRACQKKWQTDESKEKLKIRIASAMNGNRKV